MGILSAHLSKSKLSPSQFENVAELVRSRILSVCAVERIYIFGSYARGTPNDLSDLDIAILFVDREQLKGNKKIILNSKLFLDYPVDFLFYSIDEFSQKAQVGGVCAVIQSEGKIIYDKRTKV